MLSQTKNNYFFKDISDFSQFTIKFPHQYKPKLCTIIGEYHNSEILCDTIKDEKIITVADYIKETSQNFEKKVILEYDKFLCKDETIAECSLNIKYVLENINEKEYKNIKKVPFDFRSQFLGLKNQYILYNNTEILLKYKPRDILRIYVDTFFTQISKKSKFLKDEKYNEFVSILFSDYLPAIDNRFQIIGKIIKDEWKNMSDENKIKVIFDIKKTWADLSDYYIIREFFKEEDVEEYIVIVGKNHYNNICEYLKIVSDKLLSAKHSEKIFTHVVNKQTTIKDGKIKCISTQNTLEFIDYKKDDIYTMPY